jgi:hypothetical protein
MRVHYWTVLPVRRLDPTVNVTLDSLGVDSPVQISMSVRMPLKFVMAMLPVLTLKVAMSVCVTNCDHSEDAGVRCEAVCEEGDIRLTLGDNIIDSVYQNENIDEHYQWKCL